MAGGLIELIPKDQDNLTVNPQITFKMVYKRHTILRKQLSKLRMELVNFGKVTFLIGRQEFNSQNVF